MDDVVGSKSDGLTIDGLIELANSLGVSRLDAEVMLMEALGVDKAHLILHADDELPADVVKTTTSWLERRARHEPLAYILGYKEFYGWRFMVDPEVLIPRPETEALVEEALRLAKPGARVVDVGTGSGAIGITMKLERPDLDVTLTDVSEKALEVARKNMGKWQISMQIRKCDLLFCMETQFDLILANLPYVDKGWGIEQSSPETGFEPKLALFAEDGGLGLIYKLLTQIRAQDVLAKGGFVVLEADPCQHKDIIGFASNLGFEYVKTWDYALVIK